MRVVKTVPVVSIVVIMALAVFLLGVFWWQSARWERVRAVAAAHADTAATERAAAQRWRVAADVAQARVDTVVRVQRVRDVRVDSVVLAVRQLPVPEDCAETVHEHREALDSLVVSREGWRAIADSQMVVSAQLRVAHDTLAGAYQRVRRAYTLLRDPPRRLHIAPALFAGVCTNGQGCAGLGFSVTFSRR